ncbi:MAG: MarR family transcriptional regulator [Ruminococcus sp.]|jgi:DNA-binding MarR family transcriptional regulator|uniref:MarR family winged helix-turn-helix transcriptional regulator n=1 Tax=Ruminococcus sp. JE7B6 TaxID=3233380 RepID=UPI00292CFBBE|nr:MarR family transcriptional regulator [uncultured Ruminococcus sp.]MBQ1586349.1 MarR family transcriptional regulator [Ruminococcus sp.]MBQ1716597.1 MarR family transcriptional regulator [Ruminococcus sp.]MBQ1830134.1 MarR family transcriptional regulator [Ruminococcus sp.]MBQ2212594.1 MarR family transcriptional regulator [Ruminococcus sp.]MBQ2427838.1 MarR family transcriptional regulator [Ruminococcus sp.]
MEFSEYDALKLDNQVCFPLYAAAREVTKLYRPYLDALNLTYTQYITMMVLWENRSCSAKKLGEKLYLDSGTLTPVIKSLEQKGFVKRSRSAVDERVLMVEVTDKGFALREEAKSVPQKMAACTNLTPEEAQTLYKLLYKVLGES